MCWGRNRDGEFVTPRQTEKHFFLQRYLKYLGYKYNQIFGQALVKSCTNTILPHTQYLN